MNFKTIILRFRDLNIAECETIKRHQTIIDEKNYVWWGWWKKGSEKTPQDEFGALNTRAGNSPFEVFLVDSGQRKLYKALCSQISTNMDSKIESPEKEATPDYYRENTYNAWFRFESITECSESELRKYSYVNVGSLFPEIEANYMCFDNKQVYSINELIQQERTVWFIKSYYVEGGFSHLIHMTAAHLW